MEQDGRICEKLVQLKEAADMTNQQVADLSGVSIATVQRYMSGSVKDLQPDTLRRITLAVGGDPDEFFGGSEDGTRHKDIVALYERMLELANQRHAEELAAVREAHADRLKEQRDTYEDRLAKQRAVYEDRLAKVRESEAKSIKEYKRWVTVLTVAFFTLTAFIMAMLLIDVLHPSAGWIQRTLYGVTDAAKAAWDGIWRV